MERRHLWSTIHAERKALATDLGGIGADEWSTPSLCSEWTVRDVLAHMTALASTRPATFFPKLISAGFSLSRLQQREQTAALGASPSDTLSGFGAIGTSKCPPGIPVTMLGEALVHAEDIRWPLRMKHDYPIEAVVRVADSFKVSGSFIGGKRRIAGLKLFATDTDWSHGTGPEVDGPLMILVMAMAGRKAVLTDLQGDGVATLQSRP